jgi:uncharacterized LabA/DUF88 family protein
MKTVVYIDGQNFLYKAADVLIEAGLITEKQELHTISLRKLFESLLKEEGIEIRYYGTKLKKHRHTPEIEEKSKVMIDSQRRLRSSLDKQNIHFVESGKLKVRDGDRCKVCGAQDLHFQEKGVDVKLAVDAVVDSLKGEVSSIVLISSDTDLLPAVTTAKENGTHVIYVGFSDKLTNALSIAASETQIIRDSEIVDAFNDANQPQLKLVDNDGSKATEN